MKLFSALLAGLLLWSTCAYPATFPQFSPATGVLKGNANTPVTTAATSSDITAMWSGVCSSSTYLRGDGTCAAATPAGAALTRTNDTNVTVTLGGTPATALLQATSLTLGWSGTLAATRGGTGVSALGDLTRTNDTNVTMTLGGTPTGALITSTSMTLGWSGQLAASRGGTGVSSLGTISKTDDTNVTLTLGGTPAGAVINSTSFALGWTGQLSAARGGTGLSTVTDDTVLVANGTTWQSKALTDCDAATSAVTYDVTTNAWGCNTINGATGANPSASVGLSAVNGVATTFLRSDGAPAISQSISPTWTGSHTFARTTSPQIQIAQGSVNSTLEITTAGVQNWAIVNQRSTGNLLLSAATDDSAPRLTLVPSGGLFTTGATGGNQGSGTINATGLYVNGVSVNGGLQTTGTFTGTFTGFSGSVTCGLAYRKTGSQISIFIDNGAACTGTSNTTAFTITGLPTAIQPVQLVNGNSTSCQNNSLDAQCLPIINPGVSASTIVMSAYKTNLTTGYIEATPANWTASGTKGVNGGWQFSYDLGN